MREVAIVAPQMAVLPRCIPIAIAAATLALHLVALVQATTRVVAVPDVQMMHAMEIVVVAEVDTGVEAALIATTKVAQVGAAIQPRWAAPHLNRAAIQPSWAATHGMQIALGSIHRMDLMVNFRPLIFLFLPLEHDCPISHSGILEFRRPPPPRPFFSFLFLLFFFLWQCNILSRHQEVYMCAPHPSSLPFLFLHLFVHVSLWLVPNDKKA